MVYIPEAEQDNVTELLSSTVFAVSPEAVMCTFEGTAARKVNSANADQESLKAIDQNVLDNCSKTWKDPFRHTVELAKSIYALTLRVT